MTAGNELIRLTAREAVARLEAGDVTPLELIDAALARIEAVEPEVNALPTLCAERAREHARRIMADPPRPDLRGRLAGLPIAIKDLTDVAGVRTTYGSTIFAEHRPERSDILVGLLESKGGIVLAKSNSPEFGAGGNTFNEVFGKTRNPWNTALTCGGSSGGSAVALATGEVWLAHGSDLGGSLRTPATYCGVVGLRPSPGRVPHGGAKPTFNPLPVDGPMARNVADLALFLDAMAEHLPADPLSMPPPSGSFSAAVAEPRAPARIGFTPDLGGLVAVEPELAALAAAAAARFEAVGAVVEEASPDLAGADEIFQTLRAVGVVAERHGLVVEHRDALKPEIIWNYEKGLALTAEAIARAERERALLYGRVAAFFERHDLLVCPGTSVAPFDVDRRYVERIGDRVFDNYVDWMMMTYALTITGCPVVSVPCGFTTDGRPAGIQIMGRPREEAKVLQAAALFEEMAGLHRLLPIDPRKGSVPDA